MEWISSIDMEKIKKIIGFPQKDDALFLSFNYTNTLETKYNILPDKICHIHGVCGDEKLVFGHKEYEKIESCRKTDAERQIECIRRIRKHVMMNIRSFLIELIKM